MSGVFGVHVNGQTGEVWIDWTLAPPWRVKCEMVRTVSGRRVVGSLTIDARGKLPDNGLTVDVLKSVRLGRARAYADLNWPRPRKGAPQSAGDGPGRPATLTSQFYRKVWERRKALVSSGDPHPAKTLATEFKKSRPAMRSILQRIRDGKTQITVNGEERQHGKTTRKG